MAMTPLAEACAWLRAIQRDDTGEAVADRLEAAFPEVKDELRGIYPGMADAVWPQPAQPEPAPVEPEPA